MFAFNSNLPPNDILSVFIRSAAYVTASGTLKNNRGEISILLAVQEIGKHHKKRTFGLKIQELTLLDKNSVIFSHLRLETKECIRNFSIFAFA